MKRSYIFLFYSLITLFLILGFQNCTPNSFSTLDSSENPSTISQNSVLKSSLSLNNIPFYPIGETFKWNGPNSKITYDGEVPFFYINNRKYPVVMLAVNSQANYTEALQELKIQIDMAIEKGFKVIELVLANHSLSMISKIQSILKNKDVYVLLRFDLWTVASISLNPVTVVKYTINQQTNQWSLAQEFAIKKHYASDINGNWSTIPYFSSLTKEWLLAQKNSMYNLIKEINRTGLSNKIIGFKFAYMEGGEWFEAPFAKDNKGEFVYADASGTQPWLQPDLFYLGDYSDQEYLLYNEWLMNQNLSPQEIPNYISRTKPTYKNTFISANLTNEELNVLLYNRFQSERVLWVQKELASVIKQVTNKNSLVAVNNGYLFSLAHSAGSVHTALSKLLMTPEIDIITAPYNYTNARKIGEAFIPHGPSSSAAAYQKLWLHEDDSRPYWYKDHWNTTKSHNEDLGILIRNVATSLFHRNGIYLLDLYNVGWFGSNERFAEGKKTWEKLSHVYRDLIQGTVQNIVVPEVAVIIDDNSFNYVGEFGMHKEANYTVSNEMVIRRLEAAAKIGAPVRYHLFQDLNNCSLFKSYKLVVFLNQFEVNSQQMQMVNSCLKNSNRILYFQYASGIYGDSRRPNIENMAKLLEQNVTIAADDILRFTVSNKLVTKKSYKIYFEPHPHNTSVDTFRSLAASAGVHLWADSGDVIDGRGDKLMIHSNRNSVNLTLKNNTNVKEIGINSSIQLCQSCLQLSIAFPNNTYTKLIHLSTSIPNNPKAPIGLFRDGQAGFVGSANGNYCHLSSGDHLKACGYTQLDYDRAPQQSISSSINQNSYTGLCLCPNPLTSIPSNQIVPMGLFRDGFGGFKGSSDGTYCSLSSGEHLKKCGFIQLDYDNAKQFSLLKTPTYYYKGLCQCH